MNCPICDKKITKLQVIAMDTFTIKENGILQRKLTRIFSPDIDYSVQILHDDLDDNHFDNIETDQGTRQTLKSRLIVQLDSLPVEILRELINEYRTEKVMKKIRDDDEWKRRSREDFHKYDD
jgi:hypothetical protein